MSALSADIEVGPPCLVDVRRRVGGGVVLWDWAVDETPRGTLEVARRVAIVSTRAVLVVLIRRPPLHVAADAVHQPRTERARDTGCRCSSDREPEVSPKRHVRSQEQRLCRPTEGLILRIH